MFDDFCRSTISLLITSLHTYFSYFSPLLKSVLKRDEVDHFMIGEDPDEREDYISMLESRFLFLAADARSTLRLFYEFSWCS